jgi:hypothetical protein
MHFMELVAVSNLKVLLSIMIILRMGGLTGLIYQFDEFRVYIESGQIDLDFKTAEESGEIIKFSQGSLYYAENT